MLGDPCRVRRHTGLPAEFLLQGLRDLQVTMSDAQLLKKADPAATLVMLSNVNHVLKSVASDDRGANVATYSDPSLPLAPGVLEAPRELGCLEASERRVCRCAG